MVAQKQALVQAVGYLGPSGTHSEEAARCLYPGGERQLVAYPRIDSVIRAVAGGEITEGIVPIENSLEGSVNITLDTLAHDVDLVITGEIVWPVCHHLLVKPGTGEIRVIISHVQALAQCRRYLARHYPHAEQRMVDSTAEAARLVASTTDGSAAVGSAMAASRYGLTVAAGPIQDEGANYTRFVVLRRQAVAAFAGEWKTSLAFQINGERPGSLCEVLSEFAGRGVNLTRIESRPSRTGLGVYIFFIDVQGNLADRTVNDACEAIRAQAQWFKNFGSYPVMKKG
jgi:prephenate dehydratase